MGNTANTTTDGSGSSYDECMRIIRSLKEDDPKREEYLRKACDYARSRGQWKVLFFMIPVGSDLKKEVFYRILSLFSTFEDLRELGSISGDHDLYSVALEEALKHATNYKGQCMDVVYEFSKRHDGFDDLGKKAICRACELIKAQENN